MKTHRRRGCGGSGWAEGEKFSLLLNGAVQSKVSGQKLAQECSSSLLGSCHRFFEFFFFSLFPSFLIMHACTYTTYPNKHHGGHFFVFYIVNRYLFVDVLHRILLFALFLSAHREISLSIYM